MQNFYKIWKLLKQKIEFSYPVQVRRIILKENDGECIFKKNKFFISIDKNIPENHAIETLLHEVSHVLAWGKDKDFHGVNWGRAYSYVYRTFLSIYEDEKFQKK